MTKEIELTQGKFALVDDDDYGELSKYKWHITSGYVQRSYRDGGKIKNIYMHKQIIKDVKKGYEIDHINNDKTDNRKENLRVCTHSDNQKNQKSVRGTSKYRGVSYHKKTNKWVAHITVNKDALFLGYFENEIDAARKYDEMSIVYHGDFGKRNFLDSVKSFLGIDTQNQRD